MFQAARKHIGAIVMIGVASALVVGGVAAAQSESQSGSQGSRGAGPPPMGPPMKGLTYAEFHVQKNGQEQVLRLDQGKIASVNSSSITLAENDGSSVTIPLDESTKVLTGPGQSATIGDLSEGETGGRLRATGRPGEVHHGAAEAGADEGRAACRRTASAPTPGRQLIDGDWVAGRPIGSPRPVVRLRRVRG